MTTEISLNGMPTSDEISMKIKENRQEWVTSLIDKAVDNLRAKILHLDCENALSSRPFAFMSFKLNEPIGLPGISGNDIKEHQGLIDLCKALATYGYVVYVVRPIGEPVLQIVIHCHFNHKYLNISAEKWADRNVSLSNKMCFLPKGGQYKKVFPNLITASDMVAKYKKLETSKIESYLDGMVEYFTMQLNAIPNDWEKARKAQRFVAPTHNLNNISLQEDPLTKKTLQKMADLGYILVCYRGCIKIYWGYKNSKQTPKEWLEEKFSKDLDKDAAIYFPKTKK